MGRIVTSGKHSVLNVSTALLYPKHNVFVLFRGTSKLDKCMYCGSWHHVKRCLDAGRECTDHKDRSLSSSEDNFWSENISFPINYAKVFTQVPALRMHGIVVYQVGTFQIEANGEVHTVRAAYPGTLKSSYQEVLSLLLFLIVILQIVQFTILCNRTSYVLLQDCLCLDRIEKILYVWILHRVVYARGFCMFV